MVPKLGRTPGKSVLRTQKFQKIQKIPRKPRIERACANHHVHQESPSSSALPSSPFFLPFRLSSCFTAFAILTQTQLPYRVLIYCSCGNIELAHGVRVTILRKWYPGQGCQNSTEMRFELYLHIVCMLVHVNAAKRLGLSLNLRNQDQPLNRCNRLAS